MVATDREVKGCQRHFVYFGILPGVDLVLHPPGYQMGNKAQRKEPLYLSLVIVQEGQGQGPGCKKIRFLSEFHQALDLNLKRTFSFFIVVRTLNMRSILLESV